MAAPREPDPDALERVWKPTPGRVHHLQLSRSAGTATGRLGTSLLLSAGRGRLRLALPRAACSRARQAQRAFLLLRVYRHVRRFCGEESMSGKGVPERTRLSRRREVGRVGRPHDRARTGPYSGDPPLVAEDLYRDARGRLWTGFSPAPEAFECGSWRVPSSSLARRSCSMA